MSSVAASGTGTGALKRVWWLALVLGVLSVLAGIMVLAWPSATLVVVAALFGAWILVAGIMRVVSVFTLDWVSTGVRVLTGVLGVALVVVGVSLLGNILESLQVLVFLVGIMFVVDGIEDLLRAFSGDESGGARTFLVLSGVVAIAAGIALFVWPGLGLATLVLVLGIWLIVLGVVRVAVAFRLRTLATTTAGPATSGPATA